MKIAVFGLGYVGTVTAVAPTEQGHKVEGNVQVQEASYWAFLEYQAIQLPFPRYSTYRTLDRALVSTHAGRLVTTTLHQ